MTTQPRPKTTGLRPFAILVSRSWIGDATTLSNDSVCLSVTTVHNLHRILSLLIKFAAISLGHSLGTKSACSPSISLVIIISGGQPSQERATMDITKIGAFLAAAGTVMIAAACGNAYTTATAPIATANTTPTVASHAEPTTQAPVELLIEMPTPPIVETEAETPTAPVVELTVC